MSAIAQIELLARRIEREYLGYQTALKALLGEFLDRPDAYSPRTRSELAEAVREERIKALTIIAEVMYQGVDDATSDATADLGDVPQMSESAQASYFPIEAQSIATARTQVSDAMRMDEDTVMSAFRRIQLTAAMRAAQGIDPRIAFNMSKGGGILTLSFTRRGRNGATWATSVYARTVARALFVTAYTEYFLMTLLSGGIEVAAIESEEGEFITFSVTGTAADMPSMTDIQERYLHPNTTRLVSKAPVT